MYSNDGKDQEPILTELAQHKHESERLKKLYEIHRADLRASAIAAVTEYGISVVRAATECGIDRRTLTVWLQVHNAEQKALKKSRD